MLRRLLITVFLTAFFSGAAFASRKDVEAATLLNRAKDLSDIRRESGPPFRLKMSLTMTKEDGSVSQGTYTEFWVSKVRWRNEIELGDFRRTQLAVERKGWTSESRPIPPNLLEDIAALVCPRGFQSQALKADKFLDENMGGTLLRCFITRGSPWETTSELCFSKSNGVLTGIVFPRSMEGRVAYRTCLYEGYRQFGNRLVASTRYCGGQQQVRLEATLVELTFQPELDEGLFKPLQGAKESRPCAGPVVPPKVVYQANPALPKRADAVVTVSIIVGLDGHPQDLKVSNSTDHNFDRSAINAVRQWKFRPASCDGEPIEVEIAVEVAYHAR